MFLLFYSGRMQRQAKTLLKPLQFEGFLHFDFSGQGYAFGSKENSPVTIEDILENDDNDYDWCSNIARKTNTTMPWVSFDMIGRKFIVDGYSLLLGCHNEAKCCSGTKTDMICEDCFMTGWELQISDDKNTWKTIHANTQEGTFTKCKEFRHTLKERERGKYVRLISTTSSCISISSIEIYGFYLVDKENGNERNAIEYIRKKQAYWL